MGTQKRAQPELLPVKLLHIRKRLGLTQPQMLDLLNLKRDLSVGRISEYERGVREPNLIVLLHYARAAHISTDELIDDAIEVDALRIVRRSDRGHLPH
jgi:transcriptional regulator with XRE-family HTH domain